MEFFYVGKKLYIYALTGSMSKAEDYDMMFINTFPAACKNQLILGIIERGKEAFAWIYYLETLIGRQQ